MRDIAQNRKARYNYHILETFEAGIVLQGTEVKSCRLNNVSMHDSYARARGGELWLTGVHIAEYVQGNRNNHEPRRARKLLLHKREIQRLSQAVDAKGQTLVPLRFYFNKRNKIKVEIGLCKGKQEHDKRDTMRKKEHENEARRAIKQHRG